MAELDTKLLQLLQNLALAFDLVLPLLDLRLLFWDRPGDVGQGVDRGAGALDLVLQWVGGRGEIFGRQRLRVGPICWGNCASRWSRARQAAGRSVGAGFVGITVAICGCAVLVCVAQAGEDSVELGGDIDRVWREACRESLRIRVGI